MRGQRSCAKSENSLISRFSLAAALASLTLLLFACPSPISTDQGLPSPISKDLSVTETIPADGAKGFDPGQAIVVTFNKDLDPACLQEVQSPIVISPNPGSFITLSFTYASKKLVIDPHPYLENHATYTVSFKTTLQDDSGGTLPKQVDFSFTTGDNPAGDVQIDEEHPPYLHNGKLYTYEDTVDLSLRYNQTASSLQISNNPDFSNAVEIGPLSPGPASISRHWQLSNGPVAKTIYARFKDSGSGMSCVRTAAIIVDTVKPTIPPIPLTYYNASTTSLHLQVSPIEEYGIASCEWSAPPSVHFDPPDAVSPAITIAEPDDDYTLWLTVTDYAGNTSDPQSFTITRDTVRPGHPTFQGDTSPPIHLNTYEPLHWHWNASPNSDSANDTFLIQLGTQAPNPTSQTSYDLSSPEDSPTPYTFKVWQVDRAGNVSLDPLVMPPILVTPVDPANNSIIDPAPSQLVWRNFTPQNDKTRYRIYVFGPGGFQEDTERNKARSITHTFQAGASYTWYIEWILSGNALDPVDGRSPPLSGTYSFTVGGP